MRDYACDFVFPRPEESAALRRRFAHPAPLLIHGPAGAGKTFLVRALLPEFPLFLYCGESATLLAVLRSLAEQMCRAGKPRLQFACHGDFAALRRKSAVSLKGLVVDTLRDGRYALVLDHVDRPAASFGSAIREIIGWANSAVIAIARSPHMEDLGSLHGLFPDRNDRFEIRNLPPAAALDFAKSAAGHQSLTADNLSDFVARVAELSGGNPGAMLRMIAMASQDKYRREDAIKVTTLFIDYRLSSG